MPMFAEDPAQFSKSRLKSDLVAHNVKLPPAKSRKEVYVELHMKHIDQKKAVEFSSDEEEDHKGGEDAENPGDAEMPDLSALTDSDLKAALLKHGVKAGPIVASTRVLYEKKLRKLLQSDGLHNQLNGANNGMLYSDSEEEEENEEDNCAESSAEEEKQETDEEKQETDEENDQVQEESNQNGGFIYPQCFLPPMRQHTCASRNGKPSHLWNSGNVFKSSERGRPHWSKNLVGISRASSVDQHSALGSGVQTGSQSIAANGCPPLPPQTFSITEMVEEMESRGSLSSSANSERELNESNVQDHFSQSKRLGMPFLVNCTTKDTPKASLHEWGTKAQASSSDFSINLVRSHDPVKDDFRDLYPAENSPTGIYASRRRPIKGAAGRPVQYVYQGTPLSPTSLQRREVERRLAPIHIQILVFVIVTCMLYLIYVFVEDKTFSSTVSLLNNLNPGSNSEDGL